MLIFMDRGSTDPPPPPLGAWPRCLLPQPDICDLIYTDIRYYVTPCHLLFSLCVGVHLCMCATNINIGHFFFTTGINIIYHLLLSLSNAFSLDIVL